MKLTPSEIKHFRKEIYNHYDTHGRDLPWRHTTEPYNIVVSEVMLQQTQVDRVIPKYLAFVEAFPDFTALANATVADVLRLWQGLGYNSRGLRLKKLAEMVVTDCPLQ